MKKLKFLAFALTIFCSYNYSNAQIGDLVNTIKKGQGVREDDSTGTITQNKGSIEVHGNDQVKTFTMNGEKLEIVGNDHTITVKGYASSISVHGTGNMITVNSVKSINITGVDNNVYYRNSSNKNGKASSSVSGVDNAVIKLK